MLRKIVVSKSSCLVFKVTEVARDAFSSSQFAEMIVFLNFLLPLFLNQMMIRLLKTGNPRVGMKS